jgi:hypothetical protein
VAEEGYEFKVMIDAGGGLYCYVPKYQLPVGLLNSPAILCARLHYFSFKCNVDMLVPSLY